MPHTMAAPSATRTQRYAAGHASAAAAAVVAAVLAMNSAASTATVAAHRLVCRSSRLVLMTAAIAENSKGRACPARAWPGIRDGSPASVLNAAQDIGS